MKRKSEAFLVSVLLYSYKGKQIIILSSTGFLLLRYWSLRWPYISGRTPLILRSWLPPSESLRQSSAWLVNLYHLKERVEKIQNPIIANLLLKKGVESQWFRKLLPSLGTVWPFGWWITTGSTNDFKSSVPYGFRKSISPAPISGLRIY